jgi:hypothetical protein
MNKDIENIIHSYQNRNNGLKLYNSNNTATSMQQQNIPIYMRAHQQKNIRPNPLNIKKIDLSKDNLI